MTLFKECVEALGPNIIILTVEETTDYLEELCTYYPITSWGRIDWDKISNKKTIIEKDDLNDWFNENNISTLDVTILWNYTESPGIKTNLHDALQVLDHVTAVASDTFMYNLEVGYVIEFYHDGEVTIGLNKC
ncbi:CDI toxin immunity protein [Bacillus weihaiensis]|uniref:CDI toxin immunity protein n=1 Tax=Bacillus weihaiensis TaxID=1547283 RepID=UPI002357F225|nr:hypothetical protein [Bacillus weihaiensis]